MDTAEKNTGRIGEYIRKQLKEGQMGEQQTLFARLANHTHAFTRKLRTKGLKTPALPEAFCTGRKAVGRSACRMGDFRLKNDGENVFFGG